MLGDSGAIVVTGAEMIAATSRRKSTLTLTLRKTPRMTQVILLERGHC